MCLQQVKKLSKSLIYYEIWSTYSYFIWTVFMLKWYPDKCRNVFNFLFDLILLRPINNISVKQGRVFLGWTSTKLG